MTQVVPSGFMSSGGYSAKGNGVRGGSSDVEKVTDALEEEKETTRPVERQSRSTWLSTAEIDDKMVERQVDKREKA